MANRQAAIGTVDEVVIDEVLSRLYDMPIEVYRIKDRGAVVAGHGPIKDEAHRHDI